MKRKTEHMGYNEYLKLKEELGNDKATALFIESYNKLCAYWVSKARARGYRIGFEIAMSEVCVGLLSALSMFDATKSKSDSAYFSSTVCRAVRRAVDIYRSVHQRESLPVTEVSFSQLEETPVLESRKERGMFVVDAVDLITEEKYAIGKKIFLLKYNQMITPVGMTRQRKSLKLMPGMKWIAGQAGVSVRSAFRHLSKFKARLKEVLESSAA